MQLNINPKEMWDLYNKLPQQLQDYVFSSEVDDAIAIICAQNKIEDDTIVMRLIQNVLLGVLSPEKFQEELKNNLKIDINIATALSEKTDKLIFAPVKIYLNRLYNKETKDKMINNNYSNDTYREPIK